MVLKLNGNRELLSSIVIAGTGETTHSMPENLMEASPNVQAVQLEPFQHQVGGHTIVLHYDETTLCKPLIKREQHFYVNQPDVLKEFTAEYRGVIDVQLHEDDDGCISLIGYPDMDEASLKPHSGSSSPISSSSDNEASTNQDSETQQNSPILRPHNKTGSSIRLLRSGSLEVSSNKSENIFSLSDSGKKGSLNPWSLHCHKMLLTKWLNQGQSPHTSKFILLENVAARFKRPCILDLKMGTRQHGDDATEEKKKEHMAKCKHSTSSTLGVRICGMQVYQVDTHTYISQDKYYGRSLTEEGFRRSIQQFLQNGCTVRLDIIKTIIQKLKKLHALVEKQESFRFYSSSLLIMYDGVDVTGCKETGDNSSFNADGNGNGHVVVRMIDFAHTTHRGVYGDQTHDGPDKGYLLGLENLCEVFKDVLDQFSR